MAEDTNKDSTAPAEVPSAHQAPAAPKMNATEPEFVLRYGVPQSPGAAPQMRATPPEEVLKALTVERAQHKIEQQEPPSNSESE